MVSGRTRQATFDLPAAPRSAGDARRFVQRWLGECGIDGHVDGDAVVLMVSELVTNAGLHAGTGARVRVVDHGDCLRVEVTDESSVPVELRPFETGAETGRGLRIVEALSARWGVDAARTGKTVWFEVVISPTRSRRVGMSAG